MSGEFILYTTEDGRSAIQLRTVEGTAWLTQAQIADLFEVTPQAVTQHVRAIYADDELVAAATCKAYLQVRTEGDRRVSRQIAHYSLSMILAVGFRVRSPRGSQFRRWATATLSEYLVKGFAMDDARLKSPEADYFEELLARIRDIRSSERMFYQKVLDIYGTSADYDRSAEATQLFFQTVQNKMHWAAHGHTAAEVIKARVNSNKDHMGLTSWANQPKGGPPRKGDVVVAKNYLDAAEIQGLNRIVTAYLEFAELQALNRRPMAMRDWIGKLDDFLRLSDRDILTHAGHVTSETAKAKAHRAYDTWHATQLNAPSTVEAHFLEATAQAKRIGASRPKPKGQGA